MFRSILNLSLVLVPSVAFAQNLCLPQAFPQGLAPPSLSIGDNFGRSVAVYASRFVVGAIDANGHKGAVYVSTFGAGAVSAPVELTAIGGKFGDDFGAAVATDGNQILVGAPGEDSAGTNVGAAYLFELKDVGNGPQWIQTAKITPKNKTPNSEFGSSVDLWSGTLVVGAPYASMTHAKQGLVSVFDWDSQFFVWKETVLTSTSPQTEEHFGASVATENNIFIIGAPGYDDGSVFGTNAGRVFVFSRTFVNGPFQNNYFVPNHISNDRRLGSSCAIAQGRAIFGAPGLVNDNGVTSGGAWVVNVNPSGAGNAKLVTTAAGLVGVEQNVGRSVAITGSRIYLASDHRVEEQVEVNGVWQTSTELKAPFADLQSGTPQSVGDVVAANDFFTLVGRTEQNPNQWDSGQAFAFYNCGGRVTDLGGATPGTSGTPRLRFAGVLVGGMATEMRLEYAKPNSAALLLIHGGAPSPLPFKGGLLSAFPIHVIFTVPTSVTGAFAIPSVFPAGLSNQTFVLQCLLADPMGIGGVSLSNAEKLETAL